MGSSVDVRDERTTALAPSLPPIRRPSSAQQVSFRTSSLKAWDSLWLRLSNIVLIFSLDGEEIRHRRA